MEHLAGEADDGALRIDFDHRLKLEFHGSRITSDAVLLAYRELDDALGLTDLAGGVLAECRRGKNTRHMLTGLLRQSVFGRLAGCEDVNDADRLAHDPAMRAVVDRSRLERRAASTSQMGRFETAWLTCRVPGSTACIRAGRKPPSCSIMDSSVSETHGAQEGSAYNGHFACTCYHPLFVFNQFGDLERCALRPGNVHSADGWRDVLKPVVSRYRNKKCDAATSGATLGTRTRTSTSSWKPRATNNPTARQFGVARAHRLAADPRPVGRPPREVRRYYASFSAILAVNPVFDGFAFGPFSSSRMV
jgi:hypothetical protein